MEQEQVQVHGGPVGQRAGLGRQLEVGAREGPQRGGQGAPGGPGGRAAPQPLLPRLQQAVERIARGLRSWRPDAV